MSDTFDLAVLSEAVKSLRSKAHVVTQEEAPHWATEKE